MICLLALLPGLFWTGGPGTGDALRKAGIEQFCAPSSIEDLHKRIHLVTPGIDRRIKVASATTAPWVNANGWRFRRNKDGEFYYDLRAGSAALAAAEAFAFQAKAVLQIDPTALDEYVAMLKFLRTIPAAALSDVTDFGLIDDGSDHAGEILNLLSRRNLLYRVVRAADPQLRLNIASSSDNPQLFAAKVREKLTDDQRSLRVYGSEVVLCRLLGDASRARVHVLNYGRDDLDGVRLRVRGNYAQAHMYTPGSTAQPTDLAATDGFTEFSLPKIGSYAVVDLTR